MSNEPSNHISAFQKTLAIFGGIIAPIFIVYLMTKSPAPAPEAEATVAERIKPLAVVEISAESGPHVDKSGEVVVKEVCAACHAAGLMEAPKLADAAAWAPRIALGYETLLKHATEGIKMMPARGGNADLTDFEMADAVVYMANQAGANFAAPKPAEAKPAEATSVEAQPAAPAAEAAQ